MVPRRRKRRLRIQPALMAMAAILIGMLLYGVALPLAEFSQNRQRDPLEIRFLGSLAEHMRLRLLEAFAVVWIFFFGACIGSFLNVVIYRVPRGQTLLGSSRCPYCAHDIRFRHNIPVIGWLLLRGRCRDCRLPISPRYPLVEALVGGVFLVLALAELFSGGRNLPLRPTNFFSGAAWIIFQPQWDLIRLYALHCGLLAVLLSWALIWYDRQRVPATYAAAVLLALLILPLIARDVLLVPWNTWQAPRWPMSGAAAGLSAIIGAAAGGFFATCSWSTHKIHSESGDSQLSHAARGALCLAAVGAVLGWQAALSVLLVLPLTRLLFYVLFALAAPRLNASWPLALFVTVWLQTATWKLWAFVPGWPSHQASFLLAPVQLVAAIVLAGVVSRWCDDNVLAAGD